MIGSRALTPDEVSRISVFLNVRNNAMFMIGVKAGFRISEILSLKVSDVMLPGGAIVDAVSVSRRNMKGKSSGRTVVLHEEARTALGLWCKDLRRSSWLFEGRDRQPITRMQAWRVLNAAFKKADVQGKLGTHTMRKTFAIRVYNALGKDIVRTQKAMGHVSLNSTVSYLSFADSEVNSAILGA